MPTVYSYVRFSSKRQEQNDSVKRQVRLRDAWLRANPGMTLDTTISLQDLGVSAFRGRNLDPEWGDLGKFIDLAERANSPIAKGSYLLLERLDRFSRHRVSIAYTALVKLVFSGIKVVVLDPSPHQIDRDNIDQLHVVLPIITNLCLAHEQSREKSKRVSYAWLSRREAARENKLILTKRTPAWVYYCKKTNKLKLDQKKAEAILLIFEKTAAGIGQTTLVRELNGSVPPITNKKTNFPAPKWNTSYISKILNDRSVLGEFQPHTLKDGKKRVPDGPPIPDYYPRVISDELYYQAQYQKSLRKKEKTQSNTVYTNLFSGLIINDGDNETMQAYTTRTKRPNGQTYTQRRLSSYGNRRGIENACPWGIDYFPLEQVVLNALSELKPDDFEETFDTLQERTALHQQIQGLELRLQELEQSLTDISTPQTTIRLTKLLDDLQTKKLDAERKLEALVGVECSTKNQAFEGIKSISFLGESSDCPEIQNLRNKLKGIIPTIIEQIRIGIFRRNNNTTLARGIIHLRNKQQRVIAVRKSKKWRNIDRIVYYTKDRNPAVLICPSGSVVWSNLHGQNLLEKGEPSPDQRNTIESEWPRLFFVSVNGEMKDIDAEYGTFLENYLDDEYTDFASSTRRWQQPMCTKTIKLN